MEENLSQDEISELARNRLGYGLGDLVEFYPDMSHRPGQTPESVAKASGSPLGYQLVVERLRYLIHADKIAIESCVGLQTVLYAGSDFRKVNKT